MDARPPLRHHLAATSATTLHIRYTASLLFRPQRRTENILPYITSDSTLPVTLLPRYDRHAFLQYSSTIISIPARMSYVVLPWACGDVDSLMTRKYCTAGSRISTATPSTVLPRAHCSMTHCQLETRQPCTSDGNDTKCPVW